MSSSLECLKGEKEQYRRQKMAQEIKGVMKNDKWDSKNEMHHVYPFLLIIFNKRVPIHRILQCSWA